MRKPHILLVAGIGALALVPVIAQGPPDQAQQNQADQRFNRHGAARVPNHYIVVLDEDATGPDADFGRASARAQEVLARTPAGRLTHVYAFALVGFAAEMTEEEALALSQDPDVRLVEEDSVVELDATQTNAPWGLDRTDQRDRPLNGTYSYTTTGSGVNAYIIDTGIRRTHTQFGGRAFAGFDALGGATNDCHGHGTHVAGTVGGSTYGVAKSVRLYAVRVLDCSGSGSTSGVIAGVDWVTANHVQASGGQHEPRRRRLHGARHGHAQLDRRRRHVRGGGRQLERRTRRTLRPRASARRSPSDRRRAATRGRRSRTTGACVDIFAPGSSITSAWSHGRHRHPARSAAHRWPRRTSRASRRAICRTIGRRLPRPCGTPS